jgi:predicted transcriptional regulator YdeE
MVNSEQRNRMKVFCFKLSKKNEWSSNKHVNSQHCCFLTHQLNQLYLIQRYDIILDYNIPNDDNKIAIADAITAKHSKILCKPMQSIRLFSSKYAVPIFDCYIPSHIRDIYICHQLPICWLKKILVESSANSIRRK